LSCRAMIGGETAMSYPADYLPFCC